MALDVPNEASATFAPQAAVDSTDLDTIVAGVGATGVLTGCAVTAPGSAGMSVAVSAGSVLIGGTSVSVSSVAGLTIGAAGASDRKDMVVVNNAGTVSVVAGGSSGAVNGVTAAGTRDPVKGSIPANSVALAEVYVATTTASLTTAANVVDKRVFVGSYAPGNPPPYPVTTVAGRTGAVALTVADVAAGTSPAGTFNFAGTLEEAGNRVYSAGNPNLSATTPADVAATAAIGTGTTSARADHAHQGVTSVNTRDGAVTLTAADIAAGTFPGANSYSGLQTYNAGVTIPSGQPFTTGTRSVITGTRATTTNASDTVNLGTFSTTGGALELRIHAHLAAPAAGSTASVTKVYEIAANSTMGSIGNGTFSDAGSGGGGYLCLPADASADATTSNDFALEVRRSAAGTFIFRFRQKGILAAGTITFTVETLGDTAVTFTSSSTVTAAPTAVTTLHPSNSLTCAAGNVGVGMDNPTVPLEVSAGALGVGMRVTGNTSGIALLGAVNSLVTAAAYFGLITTNASIFTDTLAGDAMIEASSSTNAVRIGAGGAGASTLRVSSTDVQINDSGVVRSLPRGYIGHVNLTSSYAPAASTTTHVAASGDSVTLVAGRRYRVTVNQVASLGAVSTTAAAAMLFYLNSASIAQGGAPAGTNLATVGFPVGVQSGYGVAGSAVVEFTCAASGADIVPGTYVMIIAALANQATTVVTWVGAATPTNRCHAFLEDIGT